MQVVSLKNIYGSRPGVRVNKCRVAGLSREAANKLFIRYVADECFADFENWRLFVIVELRFGMANLE